jgi:uncharacterized protein (TIGR00369 family)
VGEQRSRTFSWSDPGDALGAASGLPGLEALRRMISGELPLPPITALMSMRLLEAEPGRVVWEAVPGEEHYNPIGTVHAGFATTLLDSAMGTAFVTLADAGTRWTTLELKANFTHADDHGRDRPRPLRRHRRPPRADGRHRRGADRGRRRASPRPRDEHHPRARRLTCPTRPWARERLA